MVRIGVCMIDVVCFIYIPIWALKSHMNTYQGRPEPTNRETISKIKLVK